MKYPILLHPASEAGTGDPAKPAIEPQPAAPAATSIVLDGKKSEREILLEKENGQLLDQVTQLKISQKKLETDNAHLADTVNQLKHPATAKPKPAIPAAQPEQPKTKGSWTFFG